MSNNPPLEVINELMTESCNESFKLSEKKKIKKESRHHLEELKLELIEAFDKNRRDSEYNQSNQINQDNQKKSDYNMHSNIRETKPRNKQEGLTYNKRSEAWGAILITDIIPESKLLSDSDNEILIHSQLNKFVPTENKRTKPLYVSKYCLITKKEFVCYKSKETFIKMQPPQFRIALNTIAYANCIKLPNTKLPVFYFYIQLIDHTEESMIKSNTYSSENDSSPESIHKSKYILDKHFIKEGIVYLQRRN